MSRDETQNIIKLQLKKPLKWNWELSTINTSSNIPLPIIQLYDNKNNLLVETQPWERRSWNGNNTEKNNPQRTQSCNKLNINDRIKIKECLLKKSNSDLIKEDKNNKTNNYLSNQLKNDILNNNIPTHKHKYTRSNTADVLFQHNLNPHNIKKSYSLSASNDIKQNYELKRSIKQTSLRNIHPIIEEHEKNINKILSCQNITKDSNDDTSRKNSPPCKQNFQDIKRKNDLRRDKSGLLLENHKNPPSTFKSDSGKSEINYELISSNAGSILVNVDSVKEKKSRRRRRSQLRNVPSSSEDENLSCDEGKRKGKLCLKSSSVNSVDKLEKRKRKCYSFNEANVTKNVNDSKYLRSKFSDNTSDVFKKEKQSTLIMGANFSRHSSKGMSGRRCQSISNICNSKDHYNPDNREIDAAYKFCNSLPSPNGTACNNNHEHKAVTKQKSLPNKEQVNGPGHPHSECHPLQWKFTETHPLCDQGYGSERSPEDELPPLPSGHASRDDNLSETCESPYPFITAENTFEIELTKGSRGLGLSVCGGVDSDSAWPGLLRIKRLFPHQPAATCGLLQVGDLILEANGVSLSGLSNCEALEMLRMTPNKVVLLVCRPPPDILSTISPISDIPPPPPRRSFSPTRTSLKTPDDLYDMKFEVKLTKVQGSLGFTLYKDELGVSGHYIRALVREPSISDGRIQPGDKILQVNGTDISLLTHEEAVQFLRQCGREVHLMLLREADRTPTTDLSPTETTPNSSFRPKTNLRQEAVDMLTDLAARKLSYESPCTSPKHSSYDVTDNAQYVDTDDKAVRPCFLELYNPNQTPVAVRKSKFNLSLAHNAYELNNLHPEMLDAPKINCSTEDASYNEEPQSLPHLGNFYHKKTSYHSQQYPDKNSSLYVTVSKDTILQDDYEEVIRSHFTHKKTYQNTSFSDKNDIILQEENYEPQSLPHLGQFNHKKPCYQSQQYTNSSLVDKSKGEILDEKDSFVKWKGVMFSAERDLLENDAQILNIELNRGWNSRLGFSLQEIEGCTCVSAVYPDSVAARDGRIRVGDCLLRVNDEMVEHMKTSDVIDLLRIVRGPVCITVLRRKLRLD